MIKNVTKFFLTSTAIFGLTQAFATEIHPFFLERQDGTVLEGYFSPPSTSGSPVIFAIQGSSCKSALEWYTGLSDQASALGLGVIVLEKQGISQEGIDLLTYNQTNCLEQRQEDYLLCLGSMPSICPGWEGKPIFWGESEGGMLAAHLASQTPETAAVLLFSLGGGMKPREEVKWALQHRMEQQGSMQEEIETYMELLDEQLDAMVLDPVADKQFLGNTYKWWASMIAAEEAAIPLHQQSLPIYLVHGTEDSQIPVQSADLAAEMLSKANTLTYLRLEGHSHDLATADVQDAAYSWLSSILLGQEALGDSHIQVATRQVSSKDTQVSSSNYILCRDPEDRESGLQGGEASAGVRADRDSDGNERISGDARVSRDFGNGATWSFGAGGSVGRDREGNVRGEVHAQTEFNQKF